MGMVVVAFFVAAADGVCRLQLDLAFDEITFADFRQALRFLLGESVLDDDIFSLGPFQLVYLLAERVQEACATVSSACRLQETYVLSAMRVIGN